MVLTDTAPTARRLVNAEAGRIRFDACERPYFTNVTRGDGAWGNPADAIAYAAQRAVAAEADHIVRIKDVDTGEEWFVPVPARFITEEADGGQWVILDTTTGWTSRPYPHSAAHRSAATANVDVLTGDWD